MGKIAHAGTSMLLAGGNPEQTELAHLLEPGHTEAFWAWVDRHPRAERAKGFLSGWSAAAQMELPPGYDDTRGDEPGEGDVVD